MRTYYVDGQFVLEDKAVIPVDDLSVLRGFGVCDLMRTYKGRPYFLTEHIKRLENSAKEIDLKLPWSTEQIETIVLKTLEKNSRIDEANIRIVITGGSSKDFLTPQGRPRLLVLVTEIPTLPGEWYEKGVKVITIEQERNIPGAKSISYIPATLALKKAKKVNAVEALYMDRNGFVQEGTTSNLFAFINKRLVTPGKGVLKGITRQVILAVTQEMFKIELRSIHINELLSADEAFISGTNKGIVPVVTVNDSTIGGGIVGGGTKKVIKALDRHTLKFRHDP